MSYPTPAQWRSYAFGARQMAEEYRLEGNVSKAIDREAHADFYEEAAEREEFRLMGAVRFLEAAE